jgi:hypothetical protein
LLVFPDGPSWVEKELGPMLSEKALDVIEDLMPKEAAKIAADVKDKGVDVAKSIWMANLKKKEQEATEKFYYMPISKIFQFEDGRNKLIFKNDSVILNVDKGEVDGDSLLDPAGLLTDTEMPFYGQKRTGGKDETESLWSIQLDKPVCCHRFRVKDLEGVRGTIDDIILNYREGIITDLVVTTIGANAGEHVVNVKDFDFETMTCKKALDV